MPGVARELELRTHTEIAQIGPAGWARVTGPLAPPFVSYDWLEALEATGCVAPERGWAPLHLGLYREGQLVAVAPAYLKGNSEGEFVFDQAWARYASVRLGVAYYPKLVVGVPFTPATGPRLWCAPELDPATARRALAVGLGALTEALDLSSAHVLFSDGAEADALAAQGLLHRLGVQYHFANPGYRSFDDYLASFRAKRRAQLRRERRAVAEQGLVIEEQTGADVTEAAIDAMADFYLATADKFVWGRRYLDRAFFHAVAARMPERLHLVLARERSSCRYVAGAFNLLGADALYGRYWGQLEARPFVHFEVCYYAGIEAAITRGLSRFEPGAGGEHKHPRGFAATVTHSTHLIRHPELALAASDFVDREATAVRDFVAMAAAGERRVAAAE